jgi:hypothetical protein
MSRRWSRARRALGALAAVALGAAGLVALTTSPAAATVSDETGFRTAWTTAGTATIDLGANITLGCNGVLSAGVSVRNSTTPIVVDGHGFSLTQTCPTGTNNGVLEQDSTGALTFQNVTITGGNTGSDGGGVSTHGSVTLTNSTISGNTGAAGTGGVLAAGSVTLTNSTISGNTATTGSGGGVFANGSVTLTNSTISGNTAGSFGGGVFADNSVTLVYATVVQNSATTGANVRTSAGLTSFGSVVALPGGSGANCAGLTGTTSHGFNLEDDAAHSCGFSTATGDPAPGTSSGLAGVVLANNGGSTLTLLPPSGSALIDAIPVAHCSDDGASVISPLVDQVGLSRPQGAGCEIGAKEVPVAAPAPAPAPVVITPKFTG